jgi:cytochrome P450
MPGGGIGGYGRPNGRNSAWGIILQFVIMDYDDPFCEARARGPILLSRHQGEVIPMILRHADVRCAAKDVKTFSSDAPQRVPIPSEEAVRSVRQLPLEVDPPEHTAYRTLVEPFFLRPKDPAVESKISVLIGRLIDNACTAGEIETVRDFAIPLQSRALAYLLNVPESEAEIWIGWGIHVFKDGDGASKGSFMEQYCRQQFERAAACPGADFFSALNQAEIAGRRLTMEEKLGFANLAFAGGRDTIIHTVTRIIHYFAENRPALDCIRNHPEMVVTAAEEFFRLYIPLTHIGRVCPVTTEVHGHSVPAAGRVSLAWSSANRDPNVFKEPNTVKLDRKPNPHLAFGFGSHNCLGQHHARAIVRSLIRQLAQRIAAIEVTDEQPLFETEADYTRKVGYVRLQTKWRRYTITDTSIPKSAPMVQD